MRLQVLATGSCVPDNLVTNERLRIRFGCDPEAIARETGIRERRHALDNQATSDLCAEAGRRCLASYARKRAAVSLEDVDLVLVASITPDMSFPSVACMVQDRLRLNCPAVDLQAGCAGFVYALVTASAYVASGASDLCLVIGGDCLSRVVNPVDVRAMSLIGDGAGAVLLARGQAGQGLLGYRLGTGSHGRDWFQRPGCGSRLPPSDELLAQGLQYLSLDERALSASGLCLGGALGGAALCHGIRDLLKECQLQPADVSWCVFQQISPRITKEISAAVGIEPGRIVVNLDRYGNTSAGSVPLSLDEINAAGKLHPGQRVLLAGFGPGLSWGAALFSW